MKMEVTGEISFQGSENDDSFAGNRSDSTLSGILCNRTKLKFCNRTEDLVNQNDGNFPVENRISNIQMNADDATFLKPTQVGRTSVSKFRKSIDRGGILKDVSNSPLLSTNKRRREINELDTSQTSSNDSVIAPKRKLRTRETLLKSIDLSGNANVSEDSIVLIPKRRRRFGDKMEGKIDLDHFPDFDSGNSFDSSIGIAEKRVGFVRKFRARNEKLVDVNFSTFCESSNESVAENIIRKESRFDPARIDVEANFSYETTMESQVSENERYESEPSDIDCTLQSENSKNESADDETLTDNINGDDESTINESDTSETIVEDDQEKSDTRTSTKSANTSAITLEDNPNVDVTAITNLMEIIDVTVDQSVNDANVPKKLSTSAQMYRDTIFSTEESSIISLPMIEVRKSHVTTKVDEWRNCESITDVIPIEEHSMFDLDIRSPKSTEKTMKLYDVADISLAKIETSNAVPECIENEKTIEATNVDRMVFDENVENSQIEKPSENPNELNVVAEIIENKRTVEKMANVDGNMSVESVKNHLMRSSPEKPCQNLAEPNVVTETTIVKPVTSCEIGTSNIDKTINQEARIETLQISSTEVEANYSRINSFNLKENATSSDTFLGNDLTNNIESATYCIDKTAEDSVTRIIPRIIPAKEMNRTYTIYRENVNEMNVELPNQVVTNDSKTSNKDGVTFTVEIAENENELPSKNASFAKIKNHSVVDKIVNTSFVKNFEDGYSNEIVSVTPRIIESEERVEEIIRIENVENHAIGTSPEKPFENFNESNVVAKIIENEKTIETANVDEIVSVENVENEEISRSPEKPSENSNEPNIVAKIIENEQTANVDRNMSVESVENRIIRSSLEKPRQNLTEPDVVMETTIVNPVTSCESIENRSPTQEVVDTNEIGHSSTKNIQTYNNADSDDDGEIFTADDMLRISGNESFRKSPFTSKPTNTLRDVPGQSSVMSPLAENVDMDTDMIVHSASVIRRSTRISFLRSMSANKTKSNTNNDSGFSFVKNFLSNKSVPSVKRKTQPAKKTAKRSRFKLDDLDESMQKLRKKPYFPKHFHSHCNDRFYAYLIKKMTPKYGIRTNSEVVKVAEYIWQTVKEVEEMTDPIQYNAKVKEMKEVLYRKQLVKTHWEFYVWCHHYMPQRFHDKAVPKLYNPEVEYDPYPTYVDIIPQN